MKYTTTTIHIDPITKHQIQQLQKQWNYKTLQQTIEKILLEHTQHLDEEQHQ